MTLGLVAMAVWEAGLLLLAIRFATSLPSWSRASGSGATFAAVVLAVDLLIASLVGTALAAAQRPEPAAYLGVLVVLLGLAYLPRRQALLTDIARLRDGVVAAAGERGLWLGLLVLAAAVPAIFSLTLPIQETDSLIHLNYMLEWLQGRGSPFDFANSYVSLWETGYLPNLVLASSDTVPVVTSLKAIVLFAMAIFLVAVELEVPRRFALLCALHSILLYHFWAGPSGLSTLKNDMIHGAGTLLLTLAIVLRAQSRAAAGQAALLALGGIFVTVKYAGVMILGAALALYGVASVARGFDRLRATALDIAIVLVAVFVSTGHFYLRNALEYGNPFYPVKLSLGGIVLPGAIDLVGTSILENITHPAVWRAFLVPSGGLSPAGLLFPALLVAMVSAAAFVVARDSYRIALRRVGVGVDVLLAVFLLVLWFLYVRAFWSASHQVGDFAYMRQLYSLRYAEAALAIGVVALASWGLRAGLPRSALAGILLVDLGSRIVLLYLWPSARGEEFIGWGVLLAAVATCGFLIRPGRGTTALAAAGALFVLLGLPNLVAHNRSHWLPRYRPVWESLVHAPPHRVFVPSEIEGVAVRAIAYPAVGAEFQHDVERGTGSDLQGACARSAPPDFVALFRRTTDAPARERLLGWARTQGECFAVRAVGGYSLLLQRVRSVAFERLPAASLKAVVHLPQEGLPTLMDERPGTEGRTDRPIAGDLVLSGPEPTLFEIRNDGAVRVVASEGDAITVRNAGPSTDGGRTLGLRYQFTAGRWTSPGLAGCAINADPELRASRRSGALAGWRVAAPAGATYRVYFDEDAGGAFARVESDSDAAFLVLSQRLPERIDTLAPVPIAIESTIRVPSSSRPVLHVFSADSTGALRKSQTTGVTSAGWQRLALRADVERYDPRAYLAIGLSNVSQGDVFEVREVHLCAGVFPDTGSISSDP